MGNQQYAQSSYWAPLSFAGQNGERKTPINTFLMILREVVGEGDL